MKRKDDLLRLAFGELSDDAARALEARADAAERAEVAAFRQLHDDLRHLPSPPPDNLTTERLRAAILDRDLKTRRPLAWGPFLFAPIALAAFAAVIVLPRLRSRPEPQIVAMDTPRIKMPAPLGPRLADEFRFQNRSLSSESRAQTAPVAVLTAPAPEKQEQAVSSPHRHRMHHRAPSEPVEEPQLDTKDFQVYNPPREASEEPAAFAMKAPIHEPVTPTIATPSTVVDAPAGVTGKTEVAVIVSSKRDLETGAPAATEKEVAGVLVGG